MPFSGIGLVNELLFVVRKVSVLRLFTDCCMMVTDYPRSFRGSFAMGAVVAFFCWLLLGGAVASAVMGVSVAEVDCSGLCGCMTPMLAVKACVSR